METIQNLLSRVEVLPLSPSLLPKLLPKLSDLDGNFDEVVEIIAIDPSLTSKLLQICNSAFFGQEEPVASVSEAVNRVGYQSVYLLVAMINGSNCFPLPNPNGIDVVRLWKHSITVAFASKFVAESARLDSNLIFTAGLLHDIGKVVLGQAQPQPMSATIYSRTDSAVVEREMILFGFQHAEVGAALLERWNLPAQLVEAVRYHHDPRGAQGFEPLAACVNLGNLFTHGQESAALLKGPEVKAIMEYLKMPPHLLLDWRQQLWDHRELIESMSGLSKISRPTK
jgi:putative nucleotidyltransferase with HDIG domain